MSFRKYTDVSFVTLGPLGPLIAISRNLAPFEELSSNASTKKFLFQSSASVHLWTPERVKVVDPASKYFLEARVNDERATVPVHRDSDRYNMMAS
jgi:hypothetical protein